MSREIGKHPALGAAYGRDDSLDDVQPEGPHGSDKYRPGDFVGGYGGVGAARCSPDIAESTQAMDPSLEMLLDAARFIEYEKPLWAESAREAVAALRARPPNVAQAQRDREPFIGVLASLAAAISLLERIPNAKKAAPSDMMFEQMLTDYRRALEIGRSALSSTSQNTPEAANAPAISAGGELAQVVPDPDMTPKRFLDDILSACDASNWDADLNTGAYYRGLKDAYEAIQFIAIEYQTSIYAWNRASA